MKKRKPKLPSWAGAVRSPLGASKDDAAQRLAAGLHGGARIDVFHGGIPLAAADRTKRRHSAAALLKTLETLKANRALDEAEKRMSERIDSRGDLWDLPEGRTQSYTPDEPWVKSTMDAVRGAAAKPLAHPVRERMDLVPWNGVLAVAETMTEGIKTHDEGAWRKLSQREHVSRAMRHLALFLVGDVAEPHLFHAACRALMALESDDYEKIPFREGEYDVEKD
jgi:hypothetical protein